jgi:molecular chaperone GrpE
MKDENYEHERMTAAPVSLQGDENEPAANEIPEESILNGAAPANNEKCDIVDIFGILNSKLDSLDGQLGKLQTEFDGKLKYDQHKEKIIDQLHREVQEYKNDLTKNLLRPMIVDIIHTIDDIGKLVNSHKKTPPAELNPQKLIRQMEDISADLEDILFRQGVEAFNSARPEYDAKRQKIINTETTGDQSKDKTVSKRNRDGYEWDGKVLRQEMVSVYIYKPEDTHPDKDISNEEIKNHE